MDFKILNLLIKYNKEFSHERIRRKGLSDTEYMICTYAYSHKDCSQDDVVSALRIDKTTVGKALNTLEEKRCISRIIDKVDRRRKRLHVTEEGYARIVDVLNLHNEWMSEVLDCLSRTEQEQFENYCSRILARAESLVESHKRLENA